MANSFKQISGNLAVKVRRMKADLPDAIGFMAKQHFQSNFTRQGFDDSKWQDVKRRKTGKGRDKTRAILSGRTGRLKKSIHVDKATWNKVVIATDRLDYAKIHNEGGRAGRGLKSVIPKRQFMGDSPVLIARINKLITNTIDKAFKS
jgi:phage gpG-like protein